MGIGEQKAEAAGGSEGQERGGSLNVLGTPNAKAGPGYPVPTWSTSCPTYMV